VKRSPLRRTASLDPGTSQLTRSAPIARTTPLASVKPADRITASRGPIFPAAGSPVSPQVRNAAGKTSSSGKLTPPAPGEFSRETKLLTRFRAGNGEIEAALCEACGRWLGRHEGQVQHIIGRGMGGCRDEVINSIVNAALLCGTPLTGCHGLATAFDADIGARGFWLPRGTDPRLAPMMLASEHGSGVLVWRSPGGRYLFERPDLGLAS
jgi:hypothetical protein